MAPLQISILFIEWGRPLEGRLHRSHLSYRRYIRESHPSVASHSVPSVSGGSKGAWFVPVYRFYKQEALTEPGWESADGFYTRAAPFGAFSGGSFEMIPQEIRGAYGYRNYFEFSYI